MGTHYALVLSERGHVNPAEVLRMPTDLVLDWMAYAVFSEEYGRARAEMEQQK